ncbi:MAG TPA: peptidoglycan-binding protein, partial [Gammaproteobacteria bacterium]|nr:peptidoglycan-binding protein [Gammaproteobacteria bacterium]
MAFGDQRLERGVTGPDVVELQLRLAGFRGSVWDGEYGPGTELQVRSFQRDVMGQADASGAVDDRTFEALFQFESNHPI